MARKKRKTSKAAVKLKGADESKVDESPSPASTREEISADKKEAPKKAPKKKGGQKKASGKVGASKEVSAKRETDEVSSAAPTSEDSNVAIDIGEDDLHVEDLDAVLDDDLDGPAARERLIAEALALVGDEESAPEGVIGSFSHAPTEGEAEEALSVREAPREKGSDAIGTIEQGGTLDDLLDDFVDLGDVSTPEARDRILAAALAHADMQEARYRVRTETGETRRWKGVIAAALLVIAGTVALAPPGFIVPDLPATITSEDQAYGIRVALLLQAQQIEAFRTREDRLPNALNEVLTSLPGVRFVKSSNRLYQLVAYTSTGEAIVYDSAAPSREFEAISRDWVTTRDSS